MRLNDGWSQAGKSFYTCFLLTSILNAELPEHILERMAEVPNESQETRHRAVSAFRKKLGGLVDQWIDSGKTEGIEDAWKRSIGWEPEGNKKPITQMLSEYERRNPPVARICADGRFDICMKPFCLNSKEPVFRAREVAIYHFACLLDSSTRERLSRCDHCGSYFVRARTPKKNTPISHGIFCEKHKGTGGARRTVETRNRRTQEMIGWAADAWVSWTPGNRCGERSTWIVRRVNAKLPPYQSAIKVNWVTRHQEEIATEVKRRNDAKD